MSIEEFVIAIMVVIAYVAGIAVRWYCKPDKRGKPCTDQMNEDYDMIDYLVSQGHSRHCACRMVWGDGVCTCRKGLEDEQK